MDNIYIHLLLTPKFFSYFHNESKNHHPSLEELFRIISNRDLATRFETYPASQASEDNDVKLEVKNDDISHNISPFKSLLLNDMFLPIPRLGKRGLDLYFWDHNNISTLEN